MQTLQELLRFWNERDVRYAYRKSGSSFMALSEGEIESIKSWRRREAQMLSPDDRGIALLELTRWSPPSPMHR